MNSLTSSAPLLTPTHGPAITVGSFLDRLFLLRLFLLILLQPVGIRFTPVNVQAYLLLRRSGRQWTIAGQATGQILRIDDCNSGVSAKIRRENGVTPWTIIGLPH
jgi:hypothetical protein